MSGITACRKRVTGLSSPPSLISTPGLACFIASANSAANVLAYLCQRALPLRPSGDLLARGWKNWRPEDSPERSPRLSVHRQNQEVVQQLRRSVAQGRAAWRRPAARQPLSNRLTRPVSRVLLQTGDSNPLRREASAVSGPPHASVGMRARHHAASAPPCNGTTLAGCRVAAVPVR